MKRTVALVAVMGLLSFAGCGGGGDNAAGDATVTTIETSVTHNVSGNWRLMLSDLQDLGAVIMTLSQTGNIVYGTIAPVDRPQASAVVDGTIDGQSITLSGSSMSNGTPITIVFSGTINTEWNSISGTVTGIGVTRTWTADRTAEPTPTTVIITTTTTTTSLPPGFTIAGNCVTDNRTGLMWTRNANLCGKVHWSDADRYCSELIYGGYSDWRLPSDGELSGLICFERRDGSSSTRYQNPALYNTAGTGQWKENDPFTGVRIDEAYWTSTWDEDDTGDIVFMRDLSDGGRAWIHNNDWELYVWPVRGGQ